MTNKPQLSDDFIQGYWEVVVEDLVNLGLNQSDATAAAAGYRAYMKPAEWAVYNRPTRETADMAQLWLGRYGQKAESAPAAAKPKGAARRKATVRKFSSLSGVARKKPPETKAPKSDPARGTRPDPEAASGA